MSSIIVYGKPASHNAAAAKKKAWAAKVKAAASRVFKRPLTATDLRVTVTFFFDASKGRMQDADNASKPICDALQGIAYANDSQVSARHARKRNINGAFTIVGADPKVLAAIQKGGEFVWIQVESEGAAQQLL